MKTMTIMVITLLTILLPMATAALPKAWSDSWNDDGTNGSKPPAAPAGAAKQEVVASSTPRLTTSNSTSDSGKFIPLLICSFSY